MVIESERQRRVPAARCRGCGVVTWVMNLHIGAWQIGAEHEKGCQKPSGRLELKRHLPLAKQPERWQIPMTDNEVEQQWKTQRLDN